VGLQGKRSKGVIALAAKDKINPVRDRPPLGGRLAP